MVDSLGRQLARAEFGREDPGAAGADGTAFESPPMAGREVTLRPARTSPGTMGVMLQLPTVRLAIPQDAVTIADMSRSYIEQGLGWSWREGRVLHAIRDRATNVAVMVEDDSIIGFGIMQYRDDAAHLSLFAVRPAHRNKGLGGRLVTWLEKPAVVAGVGCVRVEARADNQKAIGFYRRLGYQPVKTVTGYYSGIVDAVRLEKRLADVG